MPILIVDLPVWFLSAFDIDCNRKLLLVFICLIAIYIITRRWSLLHLCWYYFFFMIVLCLPKCTIFIYMFLICVVLCFFLFFFRYFLFNVLSSINCSPLICLCFFMSVTSMDACFKFIENHVTFMFEYCYHCWFSIIRFIRFKITIFMSVMCRCCTCCASIAQFLNLILKFNLIQLNPFSLWLKCCCYSCYFVYFTFYERYR